VLEQLPDDKILEKDATALMAGAGFLRCLLSHCESLLATSFKALFTIIVD
jgi:hypothetical protein